MSYNPLTTGGQTHRRRKVFGIRCWSPQHELPVGRLPLPSNGLRQLTAFRLEAPRSHLLRGTSYSIKRRGKWWAGPRHLHGPTLVQVLCPPFPIPLSLYYISHGSCSGDLAAPAAPATTMPAESSHRLALRAAGTMSDEKLIKLTSTLGTGNTTPPPQNDIETHRMHQWFSTSFKDLGCYRRLPGH